VSAIPVGVLGMGAALAHLIRSDSDTPYTPPWRATSDATRATPDVAPAATVPAAVSHPVTPATATVAPIVVRQVRPATPRHTTHPATSNPRQKARDMYDAGKSCAEIAMAVGRDKRTVERWTKDMRQAGQVPADDKEESA
jgi:hypothetical protein